MSIRERLLYPDVIASAKPGDDGRYYAEAVTNNHDTVVRTSVYWYIPDDGGEPVLMIEIDDEVDGPVPMDVRIRVRRNDALVYEGTQT